jgi:hypothetical protein
MPCSSDGLPQTSVGRAQPCLFRKILRLVSNCLLVSLLLKSVEMNGQLLSLPDLRFFARECSLAGREHYLPFVRNSPFHSSVFNLVSLDTLPRMI